MISLEAILDSKLLGLKKIKNKKSAKPKKHLSRQSQNKSFLNNLLIFAGNNASTDNSKDISEQIKIVTDGGAGKEAFESEIGPEKPINDKETAQSNFYNTKIFENIYDTVYGAVSDLFSYVAKTLYSTFNEMMNYKGKGKLKGYTDKLLNEIEDYGVVYFRSAFRNINRTTPLGAAARYLETLWVPVMKKIKV